jgi:hypothetical protein
VGAAADIADPEETLIGPAEAAPVMESTASPLKAAPAKLRITLFMFSLLPTSSSRIGEPKNFSRHRVEEQNNPQLGGAGQRLRQA